MNFWKHLEPIIGHDHFSYQLLVATIFMRKSAKYHVQNQENEKKTHDCCTTSMHCFVFSQEKNQKKNTNSCDV